ncbi:swr complex subunit, partial [Ascosphaera acerosa]
KDLKCDEGNQSPAGYELSETNGTAGSDTDTNADTAKTDPAPATEHKTSSDPAITVKSETENGATSGPPPPSPPPPHRTMEDLKARYYTVAATMLALAHPPAEMSAAEFDTHEKMMQYSRDHERRRKELAAAQLNRSVEEVREETLLLEELKRILANERQFIEDRRELYNRLEAPPVNNSVPTYNTSQGLTQLFNNLLNADKARKRRSLLGQDALASPVGSVGSQQPQSARDRDRDSKPPETPLAATVPSGGASSTVETKHTKKHGAGSGSVSSSHAGAAGAAASASGGGTPAASNDAAAAGAATTIVSHASAVAAAAPPPPHAKKLTPAEERMYGVSRHDRLSSGVHFRNDKAVKMTQAKSNIQTQKLAAALAELEIPPRLVMPTEKVVREFEKLVQQVNLLLDARKIADRVESEIRILEAARAERERKEEAEGRVQTDAAGPCPSKHTI